MELSIKVHGLKDVTESIAAAFPKDLKQQRSILNSAMRASAKKDVVPIVKRLALQGDESGALSESIAVRTMPLGKSLARGFPATVYITPVRGNLKALGMYIAHYYTSRGEKVPPKVATSGIRHGHLIEFGWDQVNGVSQPPRSFLGLGVQLGFSALYRSFRDQMGKKLEAAVRRRARKSKRSK